MNETKYTLGDVKAWARREINIEREDFIYDGARTDDARISCAYYDDNGQPSCIIGRMLDRNGLIEVEDIDGIDANGFRVAVMLNELGRWESFTDAAQKFMIRLQGLQDGGTPWGDAFLVASKDAEAVR
jgi:hypothetical protein